MTSLPLTLCCEDGITDYNLRYPTVSLDLVPICDFSKVADGVVTVRTCNARTKLSLSNTSCTFSSGMVTIKPFIQ